MVIISGWHLDEADFEDNYKLINELHISTGYIDEEPSEDIVENVKVQIYQCPSRCTLETAQNAIISKYYGDFSMTTQDYGYSEYTIEGYSVYDVKIGNHDLINILKNMEGYKIVVIEKVKK